MTTEGIVTEEMLLAAVPRVPRESIELYTVLLDEALAEFGVCERVPVAMLLGQMDVETGGLNSLVEDWEGEGNRWQRSYQGRMGNTEPGDAREYRGRGALHITGRANYRDAGAYLHLPLEEQPELAEDPSVAFRLAGWFWTQTYRGDLSRFGSDVGAVTEQITGSSTQMVAARRAGFQRALAAIPEGWALNEVDVRRARRAYDKTNEMVSPGGLLSQMGECFARLVASYSGDSDADRKSAMDKLQAIHRALFAVLGDKQCLFSARMRARLQQTLQKCTDGVLTFEAGGVRRPGALPSNWEDARKVLLDAAAAAAGSHQQRKAMERNKRLLTDLGQGLQLLAKRLSDGEDLSDEDYQLTLDRVERLRTALHGDASRLTDSDRAWMDSVLQSSSGLPVTLDAILRLNTANNVRGLLSTARSRRASAAEAAPGQTKWASNSLPEPATAAPAAAVNVWRGPLSGPVGVANLSSRLAGAGLGGGTAAPSAANNAATPAATPASSSPILKAIDARIYAIVDDALREYDRGLSTLFSDMA